MNNNYSLPQPSTPPDICGEGQKSPPIRGTNIQVQREEIDTLIGRKMQAQREEIDLKIDGVMQAHREDIHTRIDQAVQAERDRLQREAMLWTQKFLQENKKVREEAEKSCRSNEHLEQRLVKAEEEIQSLRLQLQEQVDTISEDLRPRLRRMKHRFHVHMEKHVGWRHRVESQLRVRLGRLGEPSRKQMA